MLISEKCCSFLGKIGIEEKKKKSTSKLAQPLPCCTMHCWFVDALCASPGSCVSPQGDTATHLVAAACCDPNCSSRTPEIASCLWERSAVADCFMQLYLLWRFPNMPCLISHCLSFFSLGAIPQEALHYLPTLLPQGMRQHLHRAVTLSLLTLENPVCGWRFHKSPMGKFLDIPCSNSWLKGVINLVFEIHHCATGNV